MAAYEPFILTYQVYYRTTKEWHDRRYAFGSHQRALECKNNLETCPLMKVDGFKYRNFNIEQIKNFYGDATYEALDTEKAMPRGVNNPPEDQRGTCPRCKEDRLWVGKREALNALSRKDNKTYICSPCGTAEAMDEYSANQGDNS